MEWSSRCLLSARDATASADFWIEVVDDPGHLLELGCYAGQLHIESNSQRDPNNRRRQLHGLILRSDAQHPPGSRSGGSKDGPARSLGAPWSVLRDAALRAAPLDEGSAWELPLKAAFPLQLRGEDALPPRRLAIRLSRGRFGRAVPQSMPASLPAAPCGLFGEPRASITWIWKIGKINRARTWVPSR